MIPPDDSWSECPTGVLSELQRSLNAQERHIQSRRRLLLATGMVTLGLASGAIGITLSRQKSSLHTLSCQETVKLFPQYADGTIGDARTRKAVRKHLEHCKRCREYFEETY